MQHIPWWVGWWRLLRARVLGHGDMDVPRTDSASTLTGSHGDKVSHSTKSRGAEEGECLWIHWYASFVLAFVHLKGAFWPWESAYTGLDACMRVLDYT